MKNRTKSLLSLLAGGALVAACIAGSSLTAQAGTCNPTSKIDGCEYSIVAPANCYNKCMGMSLEIRPWWNWFQFLGSGSALASLTCASSPQGAGKVNIYRGYADQSVPGKNCPTNKITYGSICGPSEACQNRSL